MFLSFLFCFFFFFNDTATTEIYTLSLHDALPIRPRGGWCGRGSCRPYPARSPRSDRKSTRLNSSHLGISYAVFCLKKKKNKTGLTKCIQIRKKEIGKPTLVKFDANANPYGCCACLDFLSKYRSFVFFFFNDTATTEIYTLSLHDALPIYARGASQRDDRDRGRRRCAHGRRSEEHTSELQSLRHLVCRLLLEKKKKKK